MGQNSQTFKRKSVVGHIRAALMEKLSKMPNGKLRVMRLNGTPLTEAQRKQLDGE